MHKDKILITGGSGFLGGYLVKAAQSKFQVTTTYYQNEPDVPDMQWIPLDLTNLQEIEKVMETVRPKIVVHNAAMTNVDTCEKERGVTQMVNIQASEHLARISQRFASRILYISTDLVFDGNSPPYSETDQPNPLSHYAWSKWQGELAVASNNPNHVIIRPAIMYGPPAILGHSFSEWMRKTWEAGQPTKLFTDQYRTPIFAGNLAQAIMELADHDVTGIIHVAGSERINRYQFGLRLSSQLGFGENLIKPAKMRDVALTGKRPADVSLTIDLARNLLNVKLLDCRDGIKAAYG